MGIGKSTLDKLREDERIVRRNLIIDAAMNLFAQKNFNQVGIRDIANEAGISAASIYRYFTDKDELFVEALFRESTTISHGLKKIVDSKRESSIEEVAMEFVDYLVKRDAFFQMMTHFMINGGISESALKRFNEIERGLLSLFDTVFEDLGASGNVRVFSHAFFASLNGILITFRNYPGRTPEESSKHMKRLAAVVADVFSNGIAK